MSAEQLNTQEVADRAGVHKATLIRWMKQGVVAEPNRDWRGWRVFGEEQAKWIANFAQGEIPQGDEANDIPSEIARLSELDWGFSDAKTSYLTHGIHPYPAKFIPQIPNALIQELSSIGDTVADIFCGSGTTLLEGLQLKRHVVGIDANPLSALVSRAKTATPSINELEELKQFHADCRELGTAVSSATLFQSKGWRPDPSVSEFWFDAHVVEELAELKLRIETLSPVAQLIAQVAFSSIIVTVSLQDSDTRYVRRAKNIFPGETVQRFCNSLRAACISSAEVSDLLESRFSCRILNTDILAAPDVPEIDLVVTSPPYPNAFSYHLYHRTRLIWLGHDPQQFKSEEIGSHRKYSAKGAKGLTELDFADEFTRIFSWLADRMRAGKYACFVIGNSTLKGRNIDNAAILSEAGARAGFREAGRLDREILSTRKSFNPAHGRIKRENILILRRQ